MMQVDDLIGLLDDSKSLKTWLNQAGFVDLELAATNLQSIAHSGMTTEQVAEICDQLQSITPQISDCDMALNNLERFATASRSRLALGALFQRDPTALPILMTIFSTSQYLADLLIRDTESYDYLRLTEGQLYSRDVLVEELVDAVSRASDPMQAMQILRRFKRRETLRISFGDLIVEQRIAQVTEQISFVAEAIVSAAMRFAAQQLEPKLGQPLLQDGQPCRHVVFALGKLGGCELNYSSDIDLIFMYQRDGETTKGKSNRQYFERLTRETVKLLSEVTSMGAAYRVDLRLRPEGSRGPICCSQNSFLQYYDLQGRTWERQALIKARSIAGHLELGEETLGKLQNWIYRPILNRFDIASIKSLKRQIEKRAVVSGDEYTNVKTGFGGIRDIEFSIQFLQLLHGGNIKSVRNHNTLQAIQLLGQEGCLNQQEAQQLENNYEWLRKVEHRLQIMFDLQTHTLPEESEELAKTAIRMGYRDNDEVSALVQFRADLVEITTVNNQILNHLLHDTFPGQEDSQTSGAALPLNAVDLILQPGIEEQDIDQLLSPYRFRNCQKAADLIQSLARETSRFLSSRRCRHFFAGVVTELLEKISQTPDPDATLVALTGVADAIGGKGALWELFNYNPPSLELFVRLCASSDYLSTIIRRNPGMIDELVDSLSLEELPTMKWLRANVDELVSGTTDVGPIFHSFKSVQHLRTGIRDILGRDDIRETHRALSDIAEVCVNEIARIEFDKLAAGQVATHSETFQELANNSFVILAMGKLGGREPNYHSDLDVIFLYDADESESLWLNTSPQHFYSELATRITKVISHRGPFGQLYEIDSRLRPSGKSGSLAVSLAELGRYFAVGGDGHLWERLALCKARPVFGKDELRERAMRIVHAAISDANWDKEAVSEIGGMRLRMQENARSANLKRGIGGTVDVEFIIQLLQAKHALRHPELLVTGTVDAATQLIKADILDAETGNYLVESYRFLRGVEARLRLMNLTARHELPGELNLERLAYLLRTTSLELASQVSNYRERNRELFLRYFEKS